MTMPTHVATDDEAIPPLRGRPWDGADLSLVQPVEAMIRDLGQRDSLDDYVDCFEEHLESAGIDASVMIDREGVKFLCPGTPADAQMRHRSRYIHFLFEALDLKAGAGDELGRRLIARGRCADNRPVTPHAVTTAVRDFIRSDGRILVTPAGRLTEGGEVPRSFLSGTDAEAAECIRASRAYFDLNLRARAREQIKRAVRMLGKSTSNGWMVLEGKGDLAPLSENGQ